ncbi:hypothetical protein EAF04_003224 [Stromatinia cepivora]|nr:hypothetical protein EAF04_003224 [Stromatinia cepivora]
MQFCTLFLAAAAATLASAVQLTNPSFGVTAGTPFNITWSDAQGPVTLVLMNGPSTSLNTVSTIGSGLSGTSYTWTPPATLDSSLYAIRIQDSTSTPNYSEQFQVSGATAAASTAASTAAASSTSVSSTGTSSSTSGSSTTGSSTTESSSSSTSSSASSSFPSTTSSNSTSTASRSSSSSTSTTRSVTTTASRTSTSTTSGSTSTATSAPTSAAAEFSSPLAFVFLAFAAIVTLN